MTYCENAHLIFSKCFCYILYKTIESLVIQVSPTLTNTVQIFLFRQVSKLIVYKFY